MDVWIELNWLKVGSYNGLWYANEPSSYMKAGYFFGNLKGQQFLRNVRVSRS
jgi:hypothetical protein